MPPPLIRYPFDPTGVLSSNIVIGEEHIITDNNYKDFYFVVPKFAPFFIEGFIVRYSNSISSRILVEGIDYYGCLPFIGASRSVGKQIYGGISFSDLTLVGIVTLSYQTLGGPYLFDDQLVLENIANRVYNPRIVTWEEVTDKPDLFPPTNHEWNLVDQVGQTEVIGALFKIEQAILTRVIDDPIQDHITRVDNPHDVNKIQLGLDLVENFPPATIDEARAMVATDRLITPATLKAILAEQQRVIYNAVLDAFRLHVTRVDNPHNTSKTQIGLGKVENFAPATTIEARGLTVANKIITPATLGSVLFDYSKLKISADPGNSLVMRVDGIYYSAPTSIPIVTPTPTPTHCAPTPTPYSSTSPTQTPTPTVTSIAYDEVIRISPQPAVGGDISTLNITGGQPNSSFAINNLTTGSRSVRQLDANGSFTESSIYVSLLDQGTNPVAFQLRYTFANQNVRNYAFISNPSSIVTTTPTPTATSTGIITWTSPTNSLGNVNVGSTINGYSILLCSGGSRSYVATFNKSANINITNTVNQIGTLRDRDSIVVSWTAQVLAAGPVSVAISGNAINGIASFTGTALPITYNEVVTFSTFSDVGGTPVTIGITGGKPNSNFDILNELSNVTFPRAFDSNGNFTFQTVIISAAEQPPTTSISVPLRFTYADTSTQLFTFVSNPVIYNEIVTFSTLSAVGGTPVTINITGGQPSSNFSILNQLSNNTFQRAFDSNGNFTLETVIISATEQGTNVIRVPLKFTFADNKTQLFTFVSNP